MGILVNGQWQAEGDVTSVLQNDKGEFVRAESVLRARISRAAGAEFPPEAGRYDLFLSHNCPWAHRTYICLNLKKLREVVSISFANPTRNAEGWWFREGVDDIQPQDGMLPLHRFYSLSDPGYTGRVTTPTLWDRKSRKVINNESAEILRMLNSEFGALGSAEIDLYPEALRGEIDAINELVYDHINNGVYRCGFARSQEAYEEAFGAMFRTLDEVEARLDRHRYLAGDQLTEADVRLFPTLVRFDPVYYSHFKCNLRRIVDYPNLSNYLRDLYQHPEFGDTVQVAIYKKGYYGNSPSLNPSGIIPVGPELSYDAPHNRATRAYEIS